MQTKKNEIWVGIFLLAGAVCLPEGGERDVHTY